METTSNQTNAEPQPTATTRTAEANKRVLDELPFGDQTDFEDARRGFIAPLPNDGVIRKQDGSLVWDLSAFQYSNDTPAPATVNPSLWRQQQLMAIGGLFEVVPGIYQIRGADLSNMTIVESKTGIIVIDTMTSEETAKTSLDLYRSERGDKPIRAIIYTHSHVDHFAGTAALVDADDIRAGKVQIIAPEQFLDEAVGENVYAGNNMSRRLTYNYGGLLPRSATGMVSAGLGLAVPTGTVGLVPPTREIHPEDQSVMIDGLEFEFMLAPETEAPSEMVFFIPAYSALTMAEDVNHLMHNVQTLRGAKPRNALNWARAINAGLQRWGERTEVLFNVHSWPTWGRENVAGLLCMQRDLYKYIHDETLRFANHGYNMDEAAQAVTLPEELGQCWANRPYYGSISHNVKGVWTYYLGWFDGNPANLDPLPAHAAGVKFVEYMGGADAVLAKAQTDYDSGQYRWVAQVLGKVLAAEPSNKRARTLLADAFTQMAYQSENATWRSIYLTGAADLRRGADAGQSKANANKTDGVGLGEGLTVEQLLEATAIRLNGPKAAGHRIAINLQVTGTGDSDVSCGLVVQHAVLNEVPTVAAPDLSLRLAKGKLAALLAGAAKLDDLVDTGEVEATGDRGKFTELTSLLDTYDLWWSVLTPRLQATDV